MEQINYFVLKTNKKRNGRGESENIVRDYFTKLGYDVFRGWYFNWWKYTYLEEGGTPLEYTLKDIKQNISKHYLKGIEMALVKGKNPRDDSWMGKWEYMLIELYRNGRFLKSKGSFNTYLRLIFDIKKFNKMNGKGHIGIKYLNNGVPDFFVIKGDKWFFVEVKGVKEGLSKSQIDFIERAKKEGFKSLVVNVV